MKKQTSGDALPALLPYERADARRLIETANRLFATHGVSGIAQAMQTLKFHAQLYPRWKELDGKEEVDQTVFDTLAVLSMLYCECEGWTDESLERLCPSQKGFQIPFETDTHLNAT